MYLLAITYEKRVYRRRSTCGGMDSEPDGSSIEVQVYNMVIPGNSERVVERAINMFRFDQSYDDSFKYHGHEIVCQVHEVCRRSITNLSIQ